MNFRCMWSHPTLITTMFLIKLNSLIKYKMWYQVLQLCIALILQLYIPKLGVGGNLFYRKKQLLPGSKCIRVGGYRFKMNFHTYYAVGPLTYYWSPLLLRLFWRKCFNKQVKKEAGWKGERTFQWYQGGSVVSERAHCIVSVKTHFESIPTHSYTLTTLVVTVFSIE